MISFLMAMGVVSSIVASALPVGAPPDDVPPIQVAVAKRLAALPEKEVDVARVGLVISTLFDPAVDVGAGLKVVDALAARVQTLLGGRTDPETRIRAINTVVYLEQQFSYDASDPMGRNIRNKHFWGFLTRKKGNCVMLPVLWLAIAQRLGFPVRAVNAPQHMFLRYEDSGFRQNIETTSGGGYFTDEKMIRDLAIPTEAISSGAMMRSLTRKEVVLQLILTLANIHFERNDLGIAAELYELVLESSPGNLDSHYNLAILLTKEAAAITSVKITNKATLARAKDIVATKVRLALSHARQATALGAVPPLEDGYWKKLKPQREAASAAPAPKPYVVEELLQPGGSPIMVNDRNGVLPSYVSSMQYGMSPGGIMGECAQMCGSAPGNICAILAPRFR